MSENQPLKVKSSQVVGLKAWVLWIAELRFFSSGGDWQNMIPSNISKALLGACVSQRLRMPKVRTLGSVAASGASVQGGRGEAEAPDRCSGGCVWLGRLLRDGEDSSASLKQLASCGCSPLLPTPDRAMAQGGWASLLQWASAEMESRTLNAHEWFAVGLAILGLEGVGRIAADEAPAKRSPEARARLFAALQAMHFASFSCARAMSDVYLAKALVRHAVGQWHGARLEIIQAQREYPKNSRAEDLLDELNRCIRLAVASDAPKASQQAAHA